jgi:hypothetical protein
MATKAEKFRERTERSAQRQTGKRSAEGKAAHEGRPSTGAKARGIRRAGEDEPGRTTRSLRAARKGGAVPEDSDTRPSRKSSRRSQGKVETVFYNEEGVASTRKGEGRVKPASNLQIRAVARVRSPESRSQRKIGGAVRAPPRPRNRGRSARGAAELPKEARDPRRGLADPWHSQNKLPSQRQFLPRSFACGAAALCSKLAMQCGGEREP